MPNERVVLSPEALIDAVGDRWPEMDVAAAAELLASGDGKFGKGVNSLPRGLVRDIQRERVLAAMLRAIAELGYPPVTVQHVLDRAALSRPTFYEHFENKDDCFLAAVDAAVRRLRRRLAEALAGAQGDDATVRLRTAIDALLRFAAEDPDAARTLLVEARSATLEALEQRNALLGELADCLGKMAGKQLAEPLSPVARIGIIGGMEALLYERLAGEAGDSAAARVEAADALMAFAAPYFTVSA